MSKTRSSSVLRYFPEDADQQTRGILARYSDLRYKAMAARQHGAKALVVVTGPRSPNAGLTVPMSFDTALAGSGIPAASVSGAVAAALFAGAPKTLQAIQQELDSGNPHAAGFPLDTITLSLKTSLVRETQTGRNVVAYFPATSPTAGVHETVGRDRGALRSPRARTQRELARGQGRRRQAASGRGRQRVGQRRGARHCRRPRQAAVRRRNLIVALWSAEEIGLVGSAAFVNAPPVPVNQLAAYLNFDMVGRMQDNKLAVQATGTSPIWASDC